MPRFFIAGSNIKGGFAYMRGKDAEHAHVLRIKPGDELVLCDTEGSDYKCRVVNAGKEELEAEIVEIVPCTSEPGVAASILCGLPKGSEKAEYIIQKCVEAGAAEICFFSCERCVAKADEEKLEAKVYRWRKIAEEAAKQSGRGIIPKVSWLGDFVAALDYANKKELVLFCYETGERESLSAALKSKKDAKSIAIITGPEGGFAPFEADMARAVGFKICSLGQRILRCETAPLVALSAVMYETGNLG